VEIIYDNFDRRNLATLQEEINTHQGHYTGYFAAGRNVHGDMQGIDHVVLAVVVV